MVTITRTLKRLALAVAAACTLTLSTAAFAQPAFRPMRLELPTEGTLALAVLDSRPDVLSGDRRESFAGFKRSLYGIPHPLHAPGKQPLADYFAHHLARAFELGPATVEIVKVSPFKGSDDAVETLQASGANRLVLLEIRDWWSDTLVHTDLHYDLKLTVFNAEGQAMGSASSIGHDELGKENRAERRDFMTAANDILATLFADESIVSAFSTDAEPLAAGPATCTVDQILTMKESGLTQEQIEAACGGNPD